MAVCNARSSILANSFPISSLSSLKPLGGFHLVLLIELHLFHQFDLNELGCCPWLHLISSAWSISGEPEEYGNFSDILPGEEFVLHNSHPMSMGLQHLLLCHSSQKTSDLLRNDQEGRNRKFYLCVLLSSLIPQKLAVEKYPRETILLTDGIFSILPYNKTD